MPTELPKAYDPREAQAKWLKFWDERGFSHSRPDANREPYTIVIPPPNVTGALQMGHALNNTLQDVLIRWRRMQGFNAEWMPGTDHDGIDTQAVVERLIFQQEKKTRHDLGREELVKRIWVWKDKYEARILGQLRELGCSCDWPRTRFTFDEGCSRAVRQTFFNWFRDGYIFAGKRLVNWATHLQTSLADDETADRQRDSNHRRRPARRSEARHRLRESDAGPRSERLRLLDAQPADRHHQHPQQGWHDQRGGRQIQGTRSLQSARSGHQRDG